MIIIIQLNKFFMFFVLHFIAQNDVFLFGMKFFIRDGEENIDKDFIAFCTTTKFNCEDGLYPMLSVHLHIKRVFLTFCRPLIL